MTDDEIIKLAIEKCPYFQFLKDNSRDEIAKEKRIEEYRKIIEERKKPDEINSIQS